LKGIHERFNFHKDESKQCWKKLKNLFIITKKTKKNWETKFSFIFKISTTKIMMRSNLICNSKKKEKEKENIKKLLQTNKNIIFFLKDNVKFIKCQLT
jgi:hypothetical protein